MDYRLTDEDKERVKLLIEVEKNKLKNLVLSSLYGYKSCWKRRITVMKKRQVNGRRNSLQILMWKFTSVTMPLSGNNQITSKDLDTNSLFDHKVS